MGSVTETRTKLLNIPDVVLDVHFAINNEDYEDLEVLRDLVAKIWEDGSDRLRNSMLRALGKALGKFDLQDDEDLNGFFKAIVGTYIPQYQETN